MNLLDYFVKHLFALIVLIAIALWLASLAGCATNKTKDCKHILTITKVECDTKCTLTFSDGSLFYIPKGWETGLLGTTICDETKK